MSECKTIIFLGNRFTLKGLTAIFLKQGFSDIMSCFVFMMHGQDQEDEITAPSHSLVKV